MVIEDIGVSTVAWDGHGWDVCFESLAEIGVARVEPAYISGYVDFTEDDFSSANAARLRRSIASHGLRPGAISGHTDMGAADAVEKLARRLAFAAEVGANALVTNAAQRKSEPAFRHALDSALPLAEAAGVILALENPGHGNDALLASGADGAVLVKAMSSPWLRLNYDVANAATYSRGQIDLAADAAAALPWCAQVHLKDYDTRTAAWSFPALGAGELDVAGFAELVRACAIAPSVALELPLRLVRPDGGDPTRVAHTIAPSEIREAVRVSIKAWSRALSPHAQSALSD
ncbi:MAG: sugar phosphate isomerase/epimerase family protein [Rhizobiaceae bacterium]